MTHKEQVLEKALENLLARIERGQEYEIAVRCALALYGVSDADLQRAYDGFCGAPESK